MRQIHTVCKKRSNVHQNKTYPRDCVKPTGWPGTSSHLLLIHEEPARDAPQGEDDPCPCEEHQPAVQRRRPVDEGRVRDGAAEGAEGVAQRAEGGQEAVQSAC